ncbi:MAG: hypothetical protein KFB96_12605 [Thiocapsa sp.]|uniref:hypothetical protein n=1 Tax=Thiocapsa sp. TaxID=2024551 RepID=UPI001BCD4692|nr:hypothetical protein [Thiocapsa sp.]QVL51157.1 MAG: hypothetical protein KFB96_12605 [Thiocapsa sp.]
MALPLELLRTLQQAPPADAWAAILDHAWTLCSAAIEPAKAASEVHARDRALGEIDHWLATAGWDLWSDYETSVPRTAPALGDWWASRSPGRAVLILDALSLREAPWILHQAELRGYSIQQARPTGAELPPNTTPFAKALGFAQRSALGNNGAGNAHKLPGARTESVDIAWADCAKLIGAEPDWVFWHRWPDHRLHDHDEPGQGLATLTQEVETQLTGDAFWSLVERLSTGRRLVLTADHGYAASGQFPDSGKDEAESLKGRFKSGRAVESAEEPGNWSPPLDLAIDSAHGRHLYVNGRRKWKSQGGYPTLTHGGLSILEVAVPFVELIRKAG